MANPLLQARNEGRRAALREHGRLGTDFDRPVDIFRIIEHERIWLSFQRLASLYGAYDRRSGNPGILINSNHPLALQRFTAAHEYGHHVLRHGTSIDEQDDFEGLEPSQDPKEVAAHAFARSFLMPPHLINEMLGRLKLDDARQITPVQAYQLAVYMGVSYLATITQLNALRMIGQSRARHLRSEQPISIKTELLGRRPDNPRTDVWWVSAEHSGLTFSPHVGDRVRVELLEKPSTGFRWHVVEAAGMELIEQGFDRGTAPGLARGGRRWFIFEIRDEGDLHLQLLRGRAWESERRPVGEFRVDFFADAEATTTLDQCISPGQLQRHLEEFRVAT